MTTIGDKIKGHGYWYILIRPTSYKREQLSYTDLEPIVRACVVRLRGWDFPHIQRGDVVRGTDFVEGATDAGDHIETWRFYQSGQFADYFAMQEDWLGRRPFLDEGDKVPEPGAVLGTTMTLYSLTEIMLFAARLAERCAFGPMVHVEFELHGLKNRQLQFFAPGRVPFSYPRTTQMEEWTRTLEIDPERLLVEAPAIALTQTLELFKRFDWSPAREQLAEEQRRLLERRF